MSYNTTINALELSNSWPLAVAWPRVLGGPIRERFEPGAVKKRDGAGVFVCFCECPRVCLLGLVQFGSVVVWLIGWSVGRLVFVCLVACLFLYLFVCIRVFILSAYVNWLVLISGESFAAAAAAASPAQLLGAEAANCPHLNLGN